jgi:hypothetical protein
MVLTTGVQYAVKTLFDRTVYFPGSKFNNRGEASQLLATSLLANTGASGGSLSRIARGTGIAGARRDILLAYRR